MLFQENASEIGCNLATLILIENKIEISEQKITTVLDTAGIKIENYWPVVVARLCKNIDCEELLYVNKKNENKHVGSKSANLSSNIDKPNNLDDKKSESSSQKTSEEEDMVFGLFD